MIAKRFALSVRWSARVHALVARVPWSRIALATILALSAFLNLFRLTSNGYGNTYYAAAIKNMLTSWHNFFFATFDAGFMSVDKPPLGLWIQAVSAKLFGFYGWSLLLPQALASLLSVALLYHLVRRAFGPPAGLLAALALALTPIVVATSRNNTMDMLVVLSTLLAAWAFIVAVETGRLRWLLVGAIVIGLGFNIKMLEAFLVLPALYLLYLVAAPAGWWRRMLCLGLATVVLLAVSLSWTIAVDLTPAEHRPFVASSSNNTVKDLIVDNNGLKRLKEGRGDISEEIGYPGPLRLLNQPLAGQIGWLLPLAVVGLLVASWQRHPRMPLDRRQQSLVLWGTWLLTQVMLFSVAGHFHAYYMVTLAPAVAALVGVGVVALWRDYRSPSWRGWLLPLTLTGMAVLQTHILATYLDWSGWLSPAIVGLCLVATTGLVVARLLNPHLTVAAYPLAATTVGVLSLLATQAVLASYTVSHGTETNYPVAGPQPQQQATSDDTVMVDYLQANQGNAKYLVATTSSYSAAPIILKTDEPVISSGDYHGRHPVSSTSKLIDLVDEGAVRFFIADGERLTELARHPKKNQVMRWVEDNCERVPQELWQQSTSKQTQHPGEEGTSMLYDCGNGAH